MLSLLETRVAESHEAARCELNAEQYSLMMLSDDITKDEFEGILECYPTLIKRISVAKKSRCLVDFKELILPPPCLLR